MALSKVDVANMLTGATPVANGGTALTSGFANGRTNNQMAPLIVNGDMAVAQRNTGTVAQADGSNEGYATVDRMQTTFGNSAGGTITTSRDTTAPTGFGQSMKFDVTGADTSLGSTHIVYTEHTLEAQVIRNSGWNYTSSSSYLTLSFQIRSSKTGTYCVYLQTNDGTAYQYTQEYTISSADTWEQKVLTFPGNSNLTFNNDNGKGLIVAWVWAVGSGRYGSAGSWTTSNAYGTSNQVNFLDSTDNIAYITGVQLEVGQFTSSTLPPFQHESFGDNLKRCMRYYQNSYKLGNNLTSTSSNNSVIVTSWNDGNCPFPNMFPVPMRDAPTVTLRPRGSSTTGQINSNGTDRSATATDASEKGVSYLTVTSGTALTYSGFTFELEAEL
jgi:hypothetical protein